MNSGTFVVTMMINAVKQTKLSEFIAKTVYISHFGFAAVRIQNNFKSIRVRRKTASDFSIRINIKATKFSKALDLI